MAMEREYNNWLGKVKYEGPHPIRQEGFIFDKAPTITNKLAKYKHIVVDTDYQNFALVYGCD